MCRLHHQDEFHDGAAHLGQHQQTPALDPDLLQGMHALQAPPFMPHLEMHAVPDSAEIVSRLLFSWGGFFFFW